jgi:hemerythrin
MADWIMWLPEYEVNVRQIDHQHEELFRRLNELMDAVWDGKGRDAIGSSLAFMALYTVDHFRTEENFMTLYSYPGYNEHKKVHDDLVQEVSEFEKKYRTEEVPVDLVVQVMNRLCDWTREHVRGMDQELGAFLLNRAEFNGAAGSRAA